MLFAPLLWYLLLTLLGWLTFPLAFRLLPGLADRGYALSRTLGLLLWGYLFWLLASLGLLYNTPGGVWLALAALTALSLPLGWPQRERMRAWLREHRRMVWMTELLFALAFVFMTVVRAANPEILGTEKPMELAFINAIMHSPAFPPHDPWLAGYAISYYYFGYVLVAMLAQATSTAAPVAFNLGLSAVFALGMTGAYGVAYTLLSPKSGRAAHPLPPLLAPAFVFLLGNAEALLEALHMRALFWRADGSSAFWAWLDIKDLTSPPQTLAWSPQRFWWWWRASRVLQDYSLGGSPKEIIDEFPAFSYVLGDLHPHVLAMPFALLAVGLALNLFRGGARRVSGAPALARWRLNAPAFALASVALGGMAFLNTWDFPIYVGLFAAAYVLRQARFGGWRRRRLGEFVTLGATLGASGALLYLPFYLGFSSQAGGLIPNWVYPTRGAHLWVMFGTLFAPLFLWLSWQVFRWRPSLRRGLAWSAALMGAGLLFALLLGNALALLPQTSALFLGGMEAASIQQAQRAFFVRRLAQPGGWLTLLALLIPLIALLADGVPVRRSRRGDMLFPALLALFGALLVLAPEFVFLRDQFGWRMNTIFKFYYQAWLLFSLAAACGIVVTLQRASPPMRSLAAAGLLLTLGAGMLYPLWAFRTKTAGFRPQRWTLDGGAYLEAQSPDDVAAIRWLEAAPPGVVAEAVGGSYSAFARVATYSGHPAVLGWPGHESQWRGGANEMGTREVDMRQLYETAAWSKAQAILKRYNVRYVFVGSLEQQAYRLDEGKFRRNLDLVFEQGQTRVYRVP